MKIPNSPYIWLTLVLASLGGLFVMAKSAYISIIESYKASEKKPKKGILQFIFFFVGFIGAVVSYILVLAWSIVDTTSIVERSSNFAVVLLTHVPYLCAVLFFLGQGICGIYFGTIVVVGGRTMIRVRILKREESPLQFWFFCLFFVGLGGVILINAFHWTLYGL
jgi:hypothetical protein